MLCWNINLWKQEEVILFDNFFPALSVSVQIKNLNNN